jgi:hypothetical protein
MRTFLPIVCAFAVSACSSTAGTKGDPGPQGAKGDTGLQGPAGPKGDTGAPGTYSAGAGISISGNTISASGDGSALTNLNAGALSSGTLPDARLSSNVPLVSSGKLSETVMPATVPLLSSGKLSDTVIPATIARAPTGNGAGPQTAHPASCKAIQSANAAAPSGIYYIQVAGAQVFPAYCDMDDGGGGWTLFYAGRNGNNRQYFTNLGGITRGDCQHPQFDCLRMLGTDRTDTNTEFASSCGDVMIKFTMTLTSLKLFRDGIATSNGAPGCGINACGYQPITPTVIYGTLAKNPNTLYTGTTALGWFIIDSTVSSGSSTFASGYPSSYDGCNFTNDRGALASLYWREVP